MGLIGLPKLVLDGRDRITEGTVTDLGRDPLLRGSGARPQAAR
jgi:hypothetical protein